MKLEQTEKGYGEAAELDVRPRNWMCADPLDPTPCVKQATTLNYTWQFFFLKEKQLRRPYTPLSRRP
jgi:hypothetical protein